MWATYFLSEVIAAMILLFVGCLGEVNNSPFFTPSIPTVAVGFGLAILMGANTMGVVSGGHMTPIITLTVFINNMLDVKVKF